MLSRISTRDRAVVLFLVVFFSRVLFWPPNLGIDDDGYRILLAGRFMANGLGMAVSRPPSYPLPEFAAILLHGLTPKLLLALVAALSGGCAVLFMAIWRRLIGYGGFFAGLALAFTPVFFSSSVQFMDHMPALFFFLAALLFALPRSRTPLAVGLFFGMCVATRLSTLPLGLPLLCIMFSQGEHGVRPIGAASADEEGQPGRGLSRSRALLGFACSFLIITLLFYAVPLYQFGSSLLTPLDIPADDVKRIAFRGTARVWGALGSIAVAALLVWTVLRLRRSPSWVWAVALGLAISYGVFLRFPFDYGYLLPAAPLVLLLAGAMLPRPGYLAFFVALAVGPFLSLNKDLRPEGTASSDLKTARERHRAAMKAVSVIRTNPQAVFALADLAPEVEWRLGTRPTVVETRSRDRVDFVPLVSTKLVFRDGYQLYVLEYNRQVVEAVSGNTAVSVGAVVVP